MLLSIYGVEVRVTFNVAMGKAVKKKLPSPYPGKEKRLSFAGLEKKLIGT